MHPKTPAPCPQCGYPQYSDGKMSANCGFSFKDRAGTAENGQISKESIMAIIGSQPVDLRDIITKRGISDISFARKLQFLLRELEKNGNVKVYVEKGRKFYLK